MKGKRGHGPALRLRGPRRLSSQSDEERQAGSKHECVAIGAMFEGNVVRPRGKLTAGGIYRLKIGGQE